MIRQGLCHQELKMSLVGEKRCTPSLANNHQATQNVVGAVRMILGNAIDEFEVGTVTWLPSDVVWEGLLGVDACTLDLEG